MDLLKMLICSKTNLEIKMASVLHPKESSLGDVLGSWQLQRRLLNALEELESEQDAEMKLDSQTVVFPQAVRGWRYLFASCPHTRLLKTASARFESGWLEEILKLVIQKTNRAGSILPFNRRFYLKSLCISYCGEVEIVFFCFI